MSERRIALREAGSLARAAAPIAIFGMGTLGIAAWVAGCFVVSVGTGLFAWWLALVMWLPFTVRMLGGSWQGGGTRDRDGPLEAHRKLLDAVRRHRGDPRLDRVGDRLLDHWSSIRSQLVELDRAIAEQHMAFVSGSGDAPRLWLERRRAEVAAELVKVSDAIRWLHAAAVTTPAEDDRSVSEALAAAEALLEVDGRLRRSGLPPELVAAASK
jgi:hypothetical protein